MAERLRLNTAIKALIILFWLIMAFLLFQRTQLVPEVELGVQESIPAYENWMAIYFKGNKIGYSVQSLTEFGEGYIADQKTYARLNMMGQIQELRTITSARLNKNMGLTAFTFAMSAGPIRFQALGELKGKNLKLTTSTGGTKSTTDIPMQETPRVAAGLIPYLIKRGVEKGERFKVPLFDPATMSYKSILVHVEDVEPVTIDGEQIETYRIRFDYLDTQTYTWIDKEGRTVKEEGLIGLSMVRTTKEEATKGIAGRADLEDLVVSTSAPTNVNLDNPKDVVYLKARLKGLNLDGLDLDGHRQKLTGDIIEVVKEEIDPAAQATLPIKTNEYAIFLKPTRFVQSDDPKITSRARAIIRDSNSPLEIVTSVNEWVYDHLEKRPTMSIPSAVDVLETRAGDCNEHSVLAAALLRAAGVPTRIAAGVVYFQGRFFYHAWLEVYYGKWMAVDALMGQVPADATHIRFLTGGLSRQAELVRIIGRLEVEILEYR